MLEQNSPTIQQNLLTTDGQILNYATILCIKGTSMLPVSGAPQLNICGAHNERPMISHKYPYSKLDSPAPSK
jgi:hypothetical protein